jgi:hypothetical protein
MPIGGSEDEAQWDIEEDEELTTLTRLLAEGIPHDQQDFFPESKALYNIVRTSQ